MCWVFHDGCQFAFEIPMTFEQQMNGYEYFNELSDKALGLHHTKWCINMISNSFGGTFCAFFLYRTQLKWNQKCHQLNRMKTLFQFKIYCFVSSCPFFYNAICRYLVHFIHYTYTWNQQIIIIKKSDKQHNKRAYWRPSTIEYTKVSTQDAFNGLRYIPVQKHAISLPPFPFLSDNFRLNVEHHLNSSDSKI